MLRGLDQSGSGKAEFSLKAAANLLKVKVSSIRSYIQKLRALEIIKTVSHGDGRYTAYYCSLFKLAVLANLTSFGPSGTIPLRLLSAGKYAVTELTARFLQRQSIRKAQFEHGPHAVATPEQILYGSSSDLSARAQDSYKGRIIGRSQRYAYVTPRFIPVGGSQAKVAELLGCSRKTVTTHLSESFRKLKGLPYLDRIQIAQRILGDDLAINNHLDEHGTQMPYNSRGFLSSSQSRDEQWQIWLPATNVYADTESSPIQMSAMAQRRTRYVRYMRKHGIELPKRDSRYSIQPYSSNATPAHCLLQRVFNLALPDVTRHLITDDNNEIIIAGLGRLSAQDI